MVGIEFSQEMQESKSIDASVSAGIEAEFWGITASMEVSVSTGFDWSQTDSDTKSEAKTYNVEIVVPAGTKLQIQEVVGLCGDSTIHTQMFKVLDSKTEKTLKTYHGKVANITTL